jgi:hypothetical protein
MTYLQDYNFDLRVARGLVPGHSLLLKFGRNADVDSASGYEDIWSGGGIWVAPTTARVHALVSADANDDDGDTGANTVVVIGLNSSYAVTTETVTMDGTTPVNTSNSYVIIYRMYVATAGSSGTNEGLITATAATDSTVTAQIDALAGQTLMAIYQVPAGKTGYITRYYASMNNMTAATSGDVRMVVTGFGGAQQTKHIVGMISTGTSFVDYRYELPLAVTEKSLIKLQGETSGNNVDITGGFDLYLVDN